MKKFNLTAFIVSLAIPLGVGALSAFLTMNSMEVYGKIEKPAFAPPSWLFPVVWTILFILMGISSYLVFNTDSPGKRQALTVYGIQLIVNFFWPVFFFILENYLVSFLWLVILWVLVIIMIASFVKIRHAAGILQIPYFLWLTFAGILNLMVFLLNRN